MIHGNVCGSLFIIQRHEECFIYPKFRLGEKFSRVKTFSRVTTITGSPLVAIKSKKQQNTLEQDTVIILAAPT